MKIEKPKSPSTKKSAGRPKSTLKEIEKKVSAIKEKTTIA